MGESTYGGPNTPSAVSPLSTPSTAQSARSAYAEKRRGQIDAIIRDRKSAHLRSFVASRSALNGARSSKHCSVAVKKTNSSISFDADMADGAEGE